MASAWFRLVGVAHVPWIPWPWRIFNFSNALHRIPPIVAAVSNLSFGMFFVGSTRPSRVYRRYKA